MAGGQLIVDNGATVTAGGLLIETGGVTVLDDGLIVMDGGAQLGTTNPAQPALQVRAASGVYTSTAVQVSTGTCFVRCDCFCNVRSCLNCRLLVHVDLVFVRDCGLSCTHSFIRSFIH